MARPEDKLRAAAAKFASAYIDPPTWWSAIEHGRRHHGTDIQRAAEWGRMKAQGVKPGIADMMFQRAGFTLWVEFKAGTNRQTPVQRQFEAAQNAIGNGYVVVRTLGHMGDALAEAGFGLGLGWQLAAWRYDAELAAIAPAKKRLAAPKAKPTLSQIARGNRFSLVGVKGGK